VTFCAFNGKGKAMCSSWKLHPDSRGRGRPAGKSSLIYAPIYPSTRGAGLGFIACGNGNGLADRFVGFVAQIAEQRLHP